MTKCYTCWYTVAIISYAYDLNGLRTSKTVTKSGTTEQHTYLYAGSVLLRETITSSTTTKVLDFSYDAQGRPFALTYTNGTASPVTYYYITNLQGDVMYLVNSSGTKVATYRYDPYGLVLSATGTMAAINPLRYRGYYYDSETGFYYLQSRYYDPQICRFINADTYTIAGTSFTSCNMFAYCNSNPVLYIDLDGCDAEVAGVWIGTMWWLPYTDGLLPIGDILFAAGSLVSLSIVPSIIVSDYLGFYVTAIPADGVPEPITPAEDTALSQSAPAAEPVIVAAGSSGDPEKDNNKNNKRHTDKQREIIARAKQAKKSGGISKADAIELVRDAHANGIEAHNPMVHVNRSGIWSYTLHININGIHIPIIICD